ncbi:MAG TPA: cache domain-containing protein, partial [Anaerolineales bacterium]|nr:cache domain-containing protein [Anaerolineales bacterium]
MIERRFLENESQDEIKRLERNSLIIAIVAGIVAIVGSIASFIFEFSNPWTIFPISLASIVAIYLIRTGWFLTGNFFIIAVSFLSSLAEVLLRSGEGLNRGVIGLVFIGGYGLAAMPRSLRGRVLLLALFVASGLTVLDIVGPPGRSAGPEAPAQTLLSLITVLVFSFFIAREYPNLDLRAKISFGILITGGISVGVITYYSVRSSELLIDTLLERVEVSVNLLAEEQLINTVVGEASVLTSTANTAATQTSSLARQLELLQDEKTLLGEGTYWNAANNMIRLGQGQYSSDTFSPRSVFVPSTVEFNETVVRELNLNAYLDFSAPFILENSPQITAVYYTNTDSITTYYPNIRLGSSLPHDFDATTQPTFRVATPLFNPDKTTRWSFPRQDPVGEGLIISVSAPVYFKDQFKGVMTSDFKLDRVAEQINNIQVGATGYAFLIDKDGHIIAMPPAGYEFFELQPEILEVGEEPQQTIFIGNNSFEVQQFTNRMVSGGSGVIETNIQGVDTFVAFAPVADKEFSLGVIVPVAELTQPIIATQNEVNEQVEGAIRNTILILITLLAGAIVVSLGLGQLIATPLLRLTQTANQILDGDLSARARIESRDESGTLAEAFNAVTTQLGETLSGLEKTIEARTSELSVANQNNERRAKQFQSIAQVARTISSTLDFDSLLSQITTVISREFGFYHVGVFLLDIASEYAVLSAANSEGGQTMLARGHRLKVGEKGLVGFVSSTGRPRVALDTGADAVFFNNPDLPDTRSEIALP